MGRSLRHSRAPRPGRRRVSLAWAPLSAAALAVAALAAAVRGGLAFAAADAAARSRGPLRRPPRIAAAAATQEKERTNTVLVIEGTQRYPVQWLPSDTVDDFKARIYEAINVTAGRQEIVNAQKVELAEGTLMQDYAGNDGTLKNLWLKVQRDAEDDDDDNVDASVLQEGWVVGVLFGVLLLLLVSPVTGANLFNYGGTVDPALQTIGDKVAARAPEAKALGKALGYSAAYEETTPLPPPTLGNTFIP